MSFYDQYEKLCIASGIKPMSEEASKKIGVTRSGISMWRKGHSPHAETVFAVAKAFGVSVDYFTSDADPDNQVRVGSVNNATPEKNAAASKFDLYFSALDEIDICKVEAYIQGLLAADKYQKRKLG